MFALFFFVNHFVMNKKDYIFNMSSLIINRLKFHAPILQDDFIDFEKVISLGVDATLPVFFYDKPMTRIIAKCFKEVKKKMPFNLVIARPDKIAQKLHPIITRNAEVRKLNVNYKSGLQFDYHKQSDFIKINGACPQKCLNGFFLESFGEQCEVVYFTREFVLSGNNYYFEFLNKSNKEQSVTFEINLDLGRGYFCFRRLMGAIQVTNLYNMEKQYFNYSSLKNNFCFSCVDGVETSCYARVYLTCTEKLKPKQKKCFFFNFGSQKFNLRSRDEIDYFMGLCQSKNSEKFDVKINCNFKNDERLCNSILPQKIYTAWLNRRRDYESERRYVMLKQRFAVRDEDGYVLKDTSSLSELKLWNGREYKSILIGSCKGLSGQYLQVGEDKFYGKNSLSFKQLSKRNCAIFVC